MDCQEYVVKVFLEKTNYEIERTSDELYDEMCMFQGNFIALRRRYYSIIGVLN